MSSEFKSKSVKFSLKDIGSEIIDQLSSDIYSGPGQIMRELIKNAYDAYLTLDLDEVEEEGFEREIVISRERNAKGVGRLLVADTAVGLTVDELKAFVQISLCKKREELENATGFRGLGSWATLGAGSRIIVTSNKDDHPFESQLVIDVRRIYSVMGPETTLDDILNNPACISFGERPSAGALRGTTVEIVCDGPPSVVNNHELNRLYEYTDPDEPKLRDILVEYCPIPFSSEGGAYKLIHDIAREAGYVLTHISLDGDRLVRGLPDDLPEPTVHELRVSGQLVAKAWITTSNNYTGLVRGIDEARHLLGGTGIQLMKYNVPLGAKNIHSDSVVRSTIPDWYIGEVHIMSPDVRPDAGGQDLRAGTAREAFISELQNFYRKLQEQGERKSEVISMLRKYRQGMAAAQSLGKTHLSAQERVQQEHHVATAVGLLEAASKRGRPSTALEKRQRDAAKDPRVEAIRKEARKVLTESKLLDKYRSPRRAAKSAKKSATKATAARSNSNGNGPQQMLSLSEIQARLARAIPRLGAIGLGQDEIQQVLEIIRELLLND